MTYGRVATPTPSDTVFEPQCSTSNFQVSYNDKYVMFDSVSCPITNPRVLPSTFLLTWMYLCGHRNRVPVQLATAASPAGTIEGLQEERLGCGCVRVKAGILSMVPVRRARSAERQIRDQILVDPATILSPCACHAEIFGDSAPENWAYAAMVLSVRTVTASTGVWRLRDVDQSAPSGILAVHQRDQSYPRDSQVWEQDSPP
jgi:hypothetical protein